MKALDIFLVLIFSVGMGLGQLLLKFSAQQQVKSNALPPMDRFLALVTDWSFLLGGTLYGCLLVYWVWLLTFLPLSRAYPFTLVSLLVAAVGGVLLFQETISTGLIVGLALIGVGLVVLTIA